MKVFVIYTYHIHHLKGKLGKGFSELSQFTQIFK